MRSTRRPTVVSVLAQAGEETSAPGGTLACSAWRGVRTVLVTLHGSDQMAVQQAVARAATLLGVESHFQWQEPGEAGALRLARLLRALQPTLVLATRATQSLVEEGWRLAADERLAMPGLECFDPTGARLWLAVGREEAQARVDVSAARPLLRAARFWYPTEHLARLAIAQDASPPSIEHFALLDGAPIPTAPPIADLFIGLTLNPPKPPISFLAEEPV